MCLDQFLPQRYVLAYAYVRTYLSKCIHSNRDFGLRNFQREMLHERIFPTSSVYMYTYILYVCMYTRSSIQCTHLHMYPRSTIHLTILYAIRHRTSQCTKRIEHRYILYCFYIKYMHVRMYYSPTVGHRMVTRLQRLCKLLNMLLNSEKFVGLLLNTSIAIH